MLDTTTVAVGGDGGQLALYTLETDARLDFSASAHSGSFIQEVIVLDASTLASCSLDGTIKLWDVSGNTLASLLAISAAHSGQIFSMALANYRGALISVSADHTAKVWDVSQSGTYSLLNTFSAHTGPIYNVVELAGTADLVCTASTDLTVKVWNWRTLQVALSIQVGYAVEGLAQVGSAVLATGGNDHLVKLWSLNDGSLLATLPAVHTASITRLKLYAYDTLVSTDVDGRVVVWNWITQSVVKQTQAFTGGGGLYRADMMSQSGLLLASLTDNSVKYLSMSAGASLLTTLFTLSTTTTPDRCQPTSCVKFTDLYSVMYLIYILQIYCILYMCI